MVLKLITTFSLLIFISTSLSAKEKFPNRVLSKESKVKTDDPFIELPETIETKNMGNKFFIYRSVLEERGLHVKSHGFTNTPKETPDFAINTMESDTFKVKVDDYSELKNKKAKYITKYVVISGSFKGLKASDTVENTYTYNLSDNNNVKYNFRYKINNKKPVEITVLYK